MYIGNTIDMAETQFKEILSKDMPGETSVYR